MPALPLSDCRAYDYSVPVEVCVDGPVGGGQTATLNVYVHGGVGASPKYLANSPVHVGHVPGWDGSEQTFTGWADGSSLYCTVTSSVLTVEAVGANQVKITLNFVLDDCQAGISYQYNDCGETPGPFTFTDMFIVPFTVYGACHHGA